MKAKELMINDWIAIDEPDRYAGATGQIKSLQYHQEDDAAYFHVFIQGKFGYCIIEVCSDDLRPIPITEDFLKANFEKKTHYGIFDDYYDFEIRKWNEGMYIVNYHCCEMPMPDTQVVGIGYVHELQHFFTMKGIEKELKV